jgi:hypothetical protein
MPIDQTQLGLVAADLMGELERIYDNDPSIRNVKITDVLLIVGVEYEQGGQEVAGVQWKVNNISAHHVLGLVEYVKTLVIQRIFHR